MKTKLVVFFFMYTFYILYSALADVYYVGHTGDAMAERLRRHLSDHHGFTARQKDWIVCYYEVFQTKVDAYAREREVKKWKSKSRIKKLIDGDCGSGHPA